MYLSKCLITLYHSNIKLKTKLIKYIQETGRIGISGILIYHFQNHETDYIFFSITKLYSILVAIIQITHMFLLVFFISIYKIKLRIEISKYCSDL